MELFKQELRVCDFKISKLSETIENFNSNSFALKEELLNKIIERENLQLQREDEIKYLIGTVQKGEVENISRLDNNKETLNKVIGDISILFQNIANLKEETDKLDILKVDSSQFSKIKEYIMDDINNVKLAMEHTKICLRDTDNYIRIYKPLNEFRQIVNIFDNVVSDKNERERLVEYVKNTKISLMDTVQLSGLLWPNFNKKEVVDIEIPTVEVDWVRRLEKQRRGRNNLQPTPEHLSISSQISKVSKEDKYVDK